jgi:uncharacterized protein involved in outer membrane biogenesis
MGQLKAGRLAIAPPTLELFGRPVTASLLLDGARDPAEAGIEVNADGLEVGRVLAALGAPGLIDGQGDMRAGLSGHGAPSRNWAATLSGHVRLLMDDGQLRQEMLDRLAGGSPELVASSAGGRAADTARIRCVALNMPVADGVAQPDLVLNTDCTTLVAYGTADPRRDRIDLTLSPQSKSLDLNWRCRSSSAAGSVIRATASTRPTPPGA